MNQELEKRQELKSQAKNIRTLFTKQKKLLKSYYKATEFDNPILMLERRSGKVEFYEKATKGTFEFKHSDGETRAIILDPSQKKSYPFLDKFMTGYYCHEDYALPLPHTALLTTQQLGMHETAMQQSIGEFQAKLERAKAMTIKQWIGLIAVVIGGGLLYMILKPTSAPEVLQPAIETVRSIPANFTLGGNP